MKFKVYKDLDYVYGHLRYGHFEGIVEAKDEEELKKMFEDEDFILDSLNLVVDDYEIDGYELDSKPYEYEVVEESNKDKLIHMLDEWIEECHQEGIDRIDEEGTLRSVRDIVENIWRK